LEHAVTDTPPTPRTSRPADDGTATTRPVPEINRRRLVGIGVSALVVCAAVAVAAVWVLVTPDTDAAAEPAAAASTSHAVAPTTPASTPTPEPDADTIDADVGGPVSEDHDVAGDTDAALAESWVRTLLGWTPQERDARGADARAREAAPGADIEVVAGAVLDHAAALAAGSPLAPLVEVLDVTDPEVWTPDWVVLDVQVITGAAPEVGVPGFVLHVVCEVQVIEGQVTGALIGDGAAWIEYDA
jgi:hypothetical protein